MVKTVILEGAEVAVAFTGANAWLRNDGEKAIYASKNAGISAGADDVVSIPAGGSAPVYDARGTVYIKGAGSVQLIGSNYAVNPFKTSAQSGGSGADEIARAAINAHAGNSAIHLTSEQLDSAVAGANAYADEKDVETLAAAKEYAEGLATGGGVSQNYVDEKDGETLAAAQTYADSAAENAVGTTNAYTDEQLSEAVSAHNTDENAHAELFAKAAAPAPTAFSVSADAWTELAETVAGCGYSAEIAAEGVTAADYPDIYFDENSLEAAAGIVVGTAAGKVVLYAKTAPATALSGAYFIRKGSAV